MSEIDLNDYKSPEIKVGDQTIQVICRIDVDSLADILVSRTNEQLFHEAATLQGYVKERTCRPVEPFDGQTKHIIARGLERIVWPYKGCPECRCDFPQGSKYCPGCGAKVVEP